MMHKLELQEQSWAPESGTPILSRDSLRAVLTSNELLMHGQARCAELEAQAQAQYQQNYERGRAQGRAQAELEYAQKLIESALIQLSALDGLETQLVAVVGSALDKIMGAIECDEVIAAQVHQHLSRLRQSKLIALTCAQSVAPQLQNELGPYFNSPLLLALSVDPELDAAQVRLTTPTGNVQAQLELVLPLLQRQIAQVYPEAAQ